ncbi:hypothetical protein, partial [Thiolapillus sp.]|uniref:hypothetical protein n=1 Tax=Thiolapillus sp. TaxID=2017437 RepID=UPI0025F496F8
QSINLLIHPDKYSMSCRLQRLLPSHVGKMRVLTFWNHGFRSSSAWQQAEFGAICKRPMLGQPGLGDQARETAGGLALVDPPGSWYQ